MIDREKRIGYFPGKKDIRVADGVESFARGAADRHLAIEVVLARSLVVEYKFCNTFLH